MKPAILLMLTSTARLAAALGQEAVVSFNGSAGDFQIAGGAISQGQILVSENDFWGVIRAAGDLAADFGRVTGTNYTLSTDATLNSTSGGGVPAAVYTFNPVNNKNNTFVSIVAGPVRTRRRCTDRIPSTPPQRPRTSPAPPTPPPRRAP